jgi:hypothetical protein
VHVPIALAARSGDRHVDPFAIVAMEERLNGCPPLDMFDQM